MVVPNRSVLVVLISIAWSGCDEAQWNESAARDEPAHLATSAQPIIGGTVDLLHKEVAVLSLFGGCTGTLIAPQVILTAAHCVSDPIGAGQTNTGSARFGTGGDDGFFARVDIADMVMYRLYQPPAFLQYDIALIRLAEDAPAEIKPAVYSRTELTDDFIGTPLTVVGFGVTNGATQTGFGTKHKVSLSLDEINFFHIGLGDESFNICQGDSGGPTFAKIDGKEQVVGVSSFGSNQCNARSFNTRVDQYAEWIDEVVSAWDGPCKNDGTCVTENCDFPDPDCDPCGFDGTCADNCPKPDLDCPTGIRDGDYCETDFDCEGRLCITAKDDPRIKFCSQDCDPADPLRTCEAPLTSCETAEGGMPLCTYGPVSKGAQGYSCKENDDCRSQICDTSLRECVEPCGDGEPECKDGYSCQDLGGNDVCKPESDDGGCGCNNANPGSLLGLALLLLVGTRRYGFGRNAPTR